MSELKVYPTDDPILLEALNAPITQDPESTRARKGSSRFPGVSKEMLKDGSVMWRASVSAKGKSYSLGGYRTEAEGALARNYGEALVEGAKKVNNVIPEGEMPDDGVKGRVAREVTRRLRNYKVLPPAEAHHPQNDQQAEPMLPPKQASQADPSEDPVAQNERLKQEIQGLASKPRSKV